MVTKQTAKSCICILCNSKEVRKNSIRNHTSLYKPHGEVTPLETIPLYINLTGGHVNYASLYKPRGGSRKRRLQSLLLTEKI